MNERPQRLVGQFGGEGGELGEGAVGVGARRVGEVGLGEAVGAVAVGDRADLLEFDLRAVLLVLDVPAADLEERPRLPATVDTASANGDCSLPAELGGFRDPQKPRKPGENGLPHARHRPTCRRLARLPRTAADPSLFGKDAGFTANCYDRAATLRVNQRSTMNWDAFWASLVGTSLPGLGVAGLLLFLSAKINRSMERHKKELEQNLVKFSKLHDKRLEAAVVIYHAFCDYLDFLRRQLYSGGLRESMDGMWQFDRTLERQIIYLDQTTANTVSKFQGELLEFWNWAMKSLSVRGESARAEIQQRLDTEIPLYLPKLRVVINSVIDPHQAADRAAV
ncbi:MAG TPA: hypothetical protein VD866_23605 [Urbifossiella sp.]|nr:hypothetical protein [Urbifossiella sp.]